MEQHERVTKLQETYESVLDEYAALTGTDVDGIIEIGLDNTAAAGVLNGSGASGSSSKKARFA